jgi:hypothetical protein
MRVFTNFANIMLSEIDGKRVKNIRNLILLLVVMLSVSVLISCSDEDKRINNSTTLAREYQGNILNANKVELIDGKTGERQIITKKDQITRILNLIKDEELIPSDIQKGTVGYIFRIILFENEELVIDFTPNRINNIEYGQNEKLDKKLKEIYKEYFEREF